MKQWGFKKYFFKRIKILNATILLSVRESLAYSGNTWGNLLSTIAYILTFLVFLEAVFNKTRTVAGYSQNEILLLLLVVQFVFLFSWFFSIVNIEQLSNLIRKGDLDLILLKPMPQLFYVSIRKVDIWSSAANLISSTVPVIIMLINKGGLQIELANLFMGIWVMIMGILAIHGFQFTISMLIFRLGQSKNLGRLTYEMTSFGGEIPFEGFPNWFKLVGLLVIPCLLPTALATSIILNKTNGTWWVPLSTIIAIIFMLLKQFSWENGLKKYQSASS